MFIVAYGNGRNTDETAEALALESSDPDVSFVAIQRQTVLQFTH